MMRVRLADVSDWNHQYVSESSAIIVALRALRGADCLGPRLRSRASFLGVYTAPDFQLSVSCVQCVRKNVQW